MKFTYISFMNRKLTKVLLPDVRIQCITAIKHFLDLVKYQKIV